MFQVKNQTSFGFWDIKKKNAIQFWHKIYFLSIKPVFDFDIFALLG